MIVFIKRNWVKLLSIFVILAITILTVMAAFPASAAETVTGWTIFCDCLGFVPAVGDALDFAELVSDMAVWLHIDTKARQPEELLVAWRELVQGTGLTEDEFSEYWNSCINDLGLADDRLIMIEETVRYGLTLSDVIAYAYATDDDNSTFTENGEIKLSAEKFQEIITRLNEQYSPKNTNKRHSWQTDKAFLKDEYTLSFFCEGYFFNSNLTDVYCIPFYYAGDDIGKYYYSLYQLHYYQEVTQDESGNNVITLYCEYWDWFNKGEHNVMSLGNHYSSTRYKRYMGFSQSEPYMNEYSVYSDYLSGRFGTSRVHSFPSGIKPFLLYDLSDLSLNTRSYWYELARSDGHSLLQANTSENIASVNNADMGLFFGSEPLNMGAYDIDFTKFPDDYSVVANGDTIYDYTIINNTSGDTSTIYNYITNNYTFPAPNTPTTPTTPNTPTNPGGDLTGNITVSGDVTVGGQVDLNVNVNVNSDSSGSSVTIDSPDLSDVAISDWYDWMKDSTSDLSGFLSDFLSWLPAGTLSILCVTLAGVCLCRFLGR